MLLDMFDSKVVWH